MIKNAFIAILITMIILPISMVPVIAMDEPETVMLHDISVYEDLITDGDMLFLVPYYIPFTYLPDTSIKDAYLFRMLSANGTTEIGANVPYPWHNLGYGSGVAQFYLESGGVWDEAYLFRVQQNPAFYDTPDYWDFTIGPVNYSLAPDHSVALKAAIVDIATDLSTEFDVELLQTNEGIITLSTYGEIYFLNAIPSLSSMCPSLFSLQVRSPTYTRRSWDTAVATALETKYQGTFIYDFMTGFAGLSSTDTSTTANFLSIILFALVVFVSVKWFKGNTVSGFLDGYTILLCLMLNGFFSMIGAGFIAFASVVVGGIILFINRS